LWTCRKCRSRGRRPPEECRRRPRLGAAHAADRMDAREMEEMVTSEVLTHVQVSLIDRGLRFIEASFRKVPPQFLPLGPPGAAPCKRTRVRVRGSERGVRR